MIKKFPYKIDPKLERKLTVLLRTLEKKDVWILIDGDEGTGKTNTACYLLYWFHCMTGRDFTLDRFYFDSNEMFEWVKCNSNGLICWDEACLGGLSAEWWSKSQINLLKFAMTGRKKHHVFVLCIPRFNKLKEDLRKDRIHAMLHMDLGRHQSNYGHFIYLTRRGIKRLNNAWEKKKIRPYVKCSRSGGFYCSVNIPYIFPQVLNEEEYEKKKDFAIDSIGKKKNGKEKEELLILKKRFANITPPVDTIKKLCEMAGISPRTYERWRQIDVPLSDDTT